VMWHFRIVLFSFILFYSVANAQDYQQKLPQKTRILFLLDGSGSMLAEWGPTQKINVAKRFLSDLVDSLQINDNLELALRVYGHQYHRKHQRCDDSKLEVGFGSNNHQKIIQKLNQIDPKGTTPLAYSLELAADDFPADGNTRNIIIIITDGIESCEGDPCEVSLNLQKRNIFLKPFIIGIGMKDDFQSEFGCMGKFYDAENIMGFKNVLGKAIYQSLEKTTVSVQLLNHENQPEVTGINISFINDFTGIPAYEFIHYKDSNNQPDTVEIDGVISYDVIVNTVPPVIQTNPDIIPGQHNLITIKCPVGNLLVKQKNHSEYKKDVEVLIYKQEENKILHTLDIEENHLFLSGYYDLDITTLPRIQFEGVFIKPDEKVTIDIPPPGILNIIRSFPGNGSLYVLDLEGREQWILNLNQPDLKTSITLQPGNYKFVFRSNNSLGSKFTKVEKFTILPGKTVDLVLK